MMMAGLVDGKKVVGRRRILDVHVVHLHTIHV